MDTRTRGVLNQVAYVVNDIGKAVDWWTSVMGVGPFFVFPELHPLGGDYRGAPMNYRIKAAIAFSGDLMVELIEPQGPSIFSDFAQAGGKGVHHLCRFADNMAQAQAELEAKGARRLQGQWFENSEVAYFDMTGDESIVIEIAVLDDSVYDLFDAIKQAGAAWDGTTRTIDFAA